MRHDPKAPLRYKVCWLCEMPLTRAAKGECGAIWDRDKCFWVPTLAKYRPGDALRMGQAASGDRTE